MVSGNTGHGHVGNHQVESLRIAAEQFQGFEAVCHGDHGISPAADHLSGKISQDLFVVDEQDALVSGRELHFYIRFHLFLS